MDQDQYNTINMSEPVATSPDETRQVATGDDFISIKEVQRIFQEHGRSITERTLQRYCEKQQLDGQKRITGEGEKWFVRESSVIKDPRPKGRGITRRNGEPLTWGGDQDVGLAGASA